MREFFDWLLTARSYTLAIAITLLLFYIYISARFLRVLRRHPSSFAVAIVGFPNSGKTVYVTTLFDELQQGKSTRLVVSPYGIDTVEEVGRNLNILGRREWLPRTKSGSVFFFRAIASAGSAGSRVRLEIADFAGEDLGELQPSNERWLHKGDYFRYVVDSDAIMLALDGTLFASPESDGIDELSNAFIACIQIVADARGAVGSKKLSVPVALLVMKADLLNEERRTEAGTRLARLVAVCETRCRYFEMFFVSSTGPLDEGNPPYRRTPSQVVEPLEWAMRSASVVTLLDAFRKVLGVSAPERANRPWDRGR